MQDRMITLDMGNTRSKVAIFAKNELVDFCVFHNDQDLEAYLREQQLPVMACTVVGKRNFEGVDIHWLGVNQKLSFTLDVAQPESVGADRLAAVMAGVSMYPNRPLLIIDAGTCITYEYVSRDGRYWGGAISPGLSLRFKSMHDYTAALPLLEALGELPPKEGRDTESAMRSGVVYGFQAEIEARIVAFERENEGSVVIMTGGDAAVLGNPLKSRIFVEPKLLHYGLYYAYQTL